MGGLESVQFVLLCGLKYKTRILLGERPVRKIFRSRCKISFFTLFHFCFWHSSGSKPPPLQMAYLSSDKRKRACTEHKRQQLAHAHETLRVEHLRLWVKPHGDSLRRSKMRSWEISNCETYVGKNQRALACLGISWHLSAFLGMFWLIIGSLLA